MGDTMTKKILAVVLVFFLPLMAGAQSVDTDAPTVSFSNTSPSSAPVLLRPISPGAVLTGQASVPVRFTDDVGLDRVQFYIDDAGQWKLLAPAVSLSGLQDATCHTTNGTNSLNCVTVDTTIAINGPHSLLAQVFDTAGNSTFAVLAVSIANVGRNVNPGVSQWLTETARVIGPDGEAVGTAVTTDRQGNAIVVGNFQGRVDFGSVTQTALGGADIFISKVDPKGTLIWSQTFGGTADEGVTAVTVDVAGDIYITGWFFGTATFGGGPLTSANGIYGRDVFVAKYSNTGAHLWSTRVGGRFGNNQGVGLAIDPTGAVIVAGNVYMEANLGGGMFVTKGSGDGFLLKLAAQTGAYVWAKVFGGPDNDTVRGVTVDSWGDVIVVGFSYVGIDFGNGARPNRGSADLFLAKFAGTDGHALWSRAEGGTGPDTAEGVVVDTNDSIFVIGNYYGTLDFGGMSVTAPQGQGAYMAKYNIVGQIQWVRSVAPETAGGGIAIRGLVIDTNGDLAITGNASGGVNFGSGVATYGDANIFVAKYGPQGGYLWAKRSANRGRSGGFAIAIDAQHNVVSTGFVQGEVNIDGLLIASPGSQVKSAFVYKVAETVVATQPDLVVMETTGFSVPPRVGDMVHLYATMRNQGFAAAGRFTLSLSVDDVLVSSCVVPSLDVGEYQTYACVPAWVVTPGTHRLTAVVDSGAVVTESDETNNRLVETVTVAR